MRYPDIHRILAEALNGLYPVREIDSIGRLVLEYLTGLNWVQIRLNQDNELTPDQEIRLSDIIDRLKKHEPIQYVLGETEFYGLKLRIRSGVLIPRGETEELVEWILEKAKGNRAERQEVKAQDTRDKAQVKAQGARLKAQDAFAVRDGVPASAGMTEKSLRVGKRLRILDIGCGSGAIAIALAKNLPDAEVIASDISEEALRLTKENAELNKVDLSIAFFDILTLDSLVIPTKVGTPSLTTDASGATPSLTTDASGGTPSLTTDASGGTPSLTTKSFDIIVSNPPYVPQSEMTTMDLHVISYEPEMALFVPDENPLLFYKAIAEFAASNLNPGGQVFVEIHDRLGEETAGIFRNWFPNVELRKDIHGKDRMIRAYHG